MRKVTFIYAVCVALTSCTYRGTYLEPPVSNTPDINADISLCLSEAKVERNLTAEERQLIAEKETTRFFMHGRPTVSPEGKPALHQSILPRFNKHTAYADRYAVCLLKLGYTWSEK